MFYNLIKRIFDLISAIILLLIISPFFLLIMVILRFTGEKEIFYFQKRLGLNNKPFFIWKFATMIKNSANIGSKDLTLRDDPRVTRVGKFLRLTKINELPQIINVIKGDISVVGPRPLMLVSFQKYDSEIQKKIYKIKPGITGIGSIVFRDEEKLISNLSEIDPHVFYKNKIAPFKGKIEIWYQNNRSFKLDLKILFFTFWVIIFPKNKSYTKIFKGIPKRNF
tara:strand:+ start:511 stop:1179 length:669 start_codon:yes stop_codon:yes gene_type:complete